MNLRVLITGLNAGDVKRLRIAAGFNSALEAARFFSIPEKTWHRWESGFCKVAHPAFVYWSLFGAALAAKEDAQVSATELPRLEDFPSVRKLIAEAIDEERRRVAQPAREEHAA